MKKNLLKFSPLGRALAPLRLCVSAVINLSLIGNLVGQPTNNIRPGLNAVMVNTNGVLQNPTNFFHANSAALNAEVIGGGGGGGSPSGGAGGALSGSYPNPTLTSVITAGIATKISFNAAGQITSTNSLSVSDIPSLDFSKISTGNVPISRGGLGTPIFDLVPAGAVYADDGSGNPIYNLTVSASATYVFDWGQGDAQLQVGSKIYGFSSVFSPGTTTIQLQGGGSPGNPVIASVSLLNSTNIFQNVTGQLGGVFTGTVINSQITNCIVWPGSLPPNIMFKSNVLYAIASGGAENYLIGTNTSNGSTLTIVRAGSTGYADINFDTAPNLGAIPLGVTQHFAIGVGASGASFPYLQPYLESYLGKESIFFLDGSGIYGGSLAGGDLVWFQNGTTNTPMFRVCRSTSTISNLYPVVCASNLTIMGTNFAAQFSGTSASFAQFTYTNGICTPVLTNLAAAISAVTNRIVDMSHPVQFVAMSTIAANINFLYATNLISDTNYQECLIQIKGDGTHSLYFTNAAAETISLMGLATNGIVPGASNGLFQLAVSRLKIPGIITNTTYALAAPNN